MLDYQLIPLKHHFLRLIIVKPIEKYMFDKRNKILFIILPATFILLGVLMFGLLRQTQDLPPEDMVRVNDLEEIMARGVLRASTNYNSTNYFIYRGEPMGFHLELLRMFSIHLGVELEVMISNDLEENFSCLLEKDGCDLIAMDLTVTKARRDLVNFTEPHSQTRQVLVQRQAGHPATKDEGHSSPSFIHHQVDLAGKTVYIQRNTVYASRLQNLMDEIGDTIYVVEMPETTEQLIEMVSRGEIDFTVSDEHLAKINNNYYSNLDITMPLSFEQHLSWAVKHGSDSLLNAINEWLVGFKATREYALLHNKYYNNPRGVYWAKSSLHSQGGGGVSVYDQYFRQYASLIGWDWRLLASLAFQESRFDHEAVSWAGAFGVMQLMPGTAEDFNIEPESSVADHIRAGVSYLRWLDSILAKHIEDEDERIKFVLAAYNVGIGHVLDARRLAEKYGKEPNVWKDNVDYFILNKSKPKYYRDPVVRFGYARGTEPYRYVYEILERYSHYRNALAI